mmetsp:Transcript_2175/g.3379  ORF Transcript_2175/g.3379 Transcript_2175/m.3379 type:complete len:445 (-) Transcript_2175:11-1345(-)
MDNPEIAVKIFSRAIQIDTRHHQAYVNLGLALVRKGDAPYAVTVFRMAIELNRHDPVALANLGLALRVMGESKAAIAASFEAVHLRPDYAQAASNAAIMLSEEQRHGEAIHLAHHAVTAVAFTVHNCENNNISRKSQNEQAVQYNLGRVCLQAGLIDEARHVFEKIQNDQGQSAGARAQALNSLAYICVMSNDIAGFEAAYQQASRFQPQLMIFLRNLGAARLKYNDFSGAVGVLNRALDGEPNNLDALLNLGVAATKLGDYDTAHSAFARGHRLSPLNPGLLYNYGLLMLKSGLQQASTAQLSDADRSIHLSISLLSQAVTQLNQNGQINDTMSNWPNNLLHTARAALSAIRELQKRRAQTMTPKYTTDESVQAQTAPPINSKDYNSYFDSKEEDEEKLQPIDLYFGSTESMDITGLETLLFSSSNSLQRQDSSTSQASSHAL